MTTPPRTCVFSPLPQIAPGPRPPPVSISSRRFSQRRSPPAPNLTSQHRPPANPRPRSGPAAAGGRPGQTRAAGARVRACVSGPGPDRNPNQPTRVSSAPRLRSTKSVSSRTCARRGGVGQVRSERREEPGSGESGGPPAGKKRAGTRARGMLEGGGGRGRAGHSPAAPPARTPPSGAPPPTQEAPWAALPPLRPAAPPTPPTRAAPSRSLGTR